MNHPNKNELLAIYYHEDVKLRKADVLSHLNSCAICRQYITTLAAVEKKLQQWHNEQPLPQTYNLISKNISVAAPASARNSFFIPITPILQIAIGICLIISIIFIIQDQLLKMPFWHAIKHCWMVETFGMFSLGLICFFCLGTFVTLSLTPIMIFESPQNRKEKFFM